jgi:TonB family protein
MIAAWMAYCIGIGLALGVAGCAMERALYLTGRPTRWAWSVALLGTLLLPLVAILRPQAFGTITVPLAAPAPRAASGATPGRTEDAVAPAPVSWRGLTWTDLDGVLRWGWGLSSVALLVVLGVAAARLAALRRGWRPALVDRRLVLVADDIGPAVAGLWPPRIVIPGWALGLTESQQRLMLAHEEEHVRARDPWLLAGGTAALVLTPWNPAVWWLLRQLRLAVEIDCDARVLGRGHSTPDYGELLLQVGQHRAHLPLTAAALGEPQSFLERRIRRMAARQPRWRWLGATAASAIAAAAVVAAREAPRPTASEVPQAAVDRGVLLRNLPSTVLVRLSDEGPSTTQQQPPQESGLYNPNADSLRRLAQQYHPEVFTHPLPGAAVALVFDEWHRVVGHAAGVREARDGSCTDVVDRLVPEFRASGWRSSGCAEAGANEAVVVYWKSLQQGVLTDSMVDERLVFVSAPPLQYPSLLRQAGIQGRVMVRAIIDSTGRAEPASVQVIESPHPGFDQAARNLVLQARFRPGRLRGRAIRVLVEFSN